MSDRAIRHDGHDSMQPIPRPYAHLRRLEPPNDLLDSVMRQVAATPQRAERSAWLAWPAAVGGLGAAALVLLAAITLLASIGEQRTGPPPSAAPTATERASAGAIADPTPLPMPTPEPVPVEARISVPEVHALQVIVADDLVWMVGDDNGLYAIDPASNEVVREVALPPHVPAGAIGFGSAWFADTASDVVRRVDLESGEVIAEIAVGDRPETVTVGHGSVWVSNLHSGTVSRVDPNADQVLATIQLGEAGASGPKWIGVGDDDVWATVPNRNAVIQVDVDSNEAVAAVEANEHALACGPVLVQARDVWASSCGEREALIHVDRATGTSTTLLVGGYVGSLLDVGGFLVFPVTPRGSPTSYVAILDPGRSQLSRLVDVGPGGFSSAAVGFGSLWVADEPGGPVVRVALSDVLP